MLKISISLFGNDNVIPNLFEFYKVTLIIIATVVNIYIICILLVVSIM